MKICAHVYLMAIGCISTYVCIVQEHNYSYVIISTSYMWFTGMLSWQFIYIRNCYH